MKVVGTMAMQRRRRTHVHTGRLPFISAPHIGGSTCAAKAAGPRPRRCCLLVEQKLGSMEPPVANCFREISEFDAAAKRSSANGSRGGEDFDAQRWFHHQYRPVAGPPQMII